MILIETKHLKYSISLITLDCFFPEEIDIKPYEAMYFNTNLGFYILFEKWMVMTTGDLGKDCGFQTEKSFEFDILSWIMHWMAYTCVHF